MEPFEGYETVKTIACKKFLVTMGFTKLQHSKIKQLGIDKDFDAIFVVDPELSVLTKKDIFKKYCQTPGTYRMMYWCLEMTRNLINAAEELGIETVIYNYSREQPLLQGEPTIRSFGEILPYLE